MTAGSLPASYYGNSFVVMIENNILAVAAGPAITVAPNAETGFVSNYNLFDLTGSGAIANWEGVSYTSLAAWYYATGQDQLSQTGNPGFVDPAGANGVLGFVAPTGATQVHRQQFADRFLATGTWTPTTLAGFDGNSLQTAAGSGATATWTFTGLTPGEIYQIGATWPNNFIIGEGNDAQYTVTDGNGKVLASAALDQYDGLSGTTAGDFASSGTAFATVGVFVATTTTAIVTLASNAGNIVIADATVLVTARHQRGFGRQFPRAARLADDRCGQPGDAVQPGTGAKRRPRQPGLRRRHGTGADQRGPDASTAQPGEFRKIRGRRAGADRHRQQQPRSESGDPADQRRRRGDHHRHAGQLAGRYRRDEQWCHHVHQHRLHHRPRQRAGRAVHHRRLRQRERRAPRSTTIFRSPTALTPSGFTSPIRIATAAGQRVFNVIVNGTTMVADYDIYKAAGGENIAVELDLTVTATGGNGIDLSLVSVSGYYGAMINAIEVDQTVPGGAVAPTVNLEVSTNDGATWSPIATDVPINRFGQAQYVWTVDRTTTGSTALIRAVSGALTATSQPVLLANGGTIFYIDNSSLTGNQYTIAIGNDANSGKSPDQPMASLAALLRAYPIVAGDTIYVDTGNYVATSDAVAARRRWGHRNEPGADHRPNQRRHRRNRPQQHIARHRRDRRHRCELHYHRESRTDRCRLRLCAQRHLHRRHAAERFRLRQRLDGVFTPSSGAIRGLTIASSAIYDNIGPGITLQDSVTQRHDLQRPGIRQQQRRHRRARLRGHRHDQRRRGL